MRTNSRPEMYHAEYLMSQFDPIEKEVNKVLLRKNRDIKICEKISKEICQLKLLLDDTLAEDNVIIESVRKFITTYDGVEDDIISIKKEDYNNLKSSFNKIIYGK